MSSQTAPDVQRRALRVARPALALPVISGIGEHLCVILDDFTSFGHVCHLYIIHVHLQWLRAKKRETLNYLNFELFNHAVLSCWILEATKSVVK